MTVADERVLLYGMRVHSELPLHQHHLLDDEGPADLTIRVGDPVPPTEEPPTGNVLLDLELDRRMYVAAAAPDGSFTLRCYRACDFVLDSTLSEVTVHLVQGADPELASVLATGMLASFVLVLRGHTVLHASAVQVDDVAVAFVGRSGMGKSTMAALMCAEGASLVTDDVLRVDLPGSSGAPMCHRGAMELRLRKSAGHLASRFAGDVGQRRTVDERDALRLEGSAVTQLPLAAIVIPMPEHDQAVTEPTLTRLGGAESLLTLVRFPRLLGWRDQGIIDRHFHELGDIVRQVPVYTARMPWGPPFPDAIAASVLEAVGLSLDA